MHSTNDRSVFQAYSDTCSELKDLYAHLQTGEDQEDAFHTEKTCLGNSNYANGVIAQTLDKMYYMALETRSIASA